MMVNDPNQPAIPDDLKQQAENRRAGRFAPGQSGNPAGRPAGRKHNVTVMIEALLEADGENMARKLVEKALAGNIDALKLFKT